MQKRYPSLHKRTKGQEITESICDSLPNIIKIYHFGEIGDYSEPSAFERAIAISIVSEPISVSSDDTNYSGNSTDSDSFGGGDFGGGGGSGDY